MVVELTAIEGAEPTVTDAVAVLTQPAADVPVTVYVVLTDGDTAALAPVAPVFQVYVLAPEATKVTVGSGVTDTIETAVLVHPLVVPVTVKFVFVVGDTFNGFNNDPVFQVYVLAPEATKVPDDPAQIVVLLTAMLGNALTVTLTVLVFVQPAVLVPVTV